jgi:pilus assembly protein Flp/PilA
MRKPASAIGALFADQSGASLIEYSILIGLITATVISMVSGIGSWMISEWQVLTSAITQ